MDESGHDGEQSDLRVLSRSDLETVVRERTAELQNVMDTMADLLIKLDVEGRIEMTNEAVETVLGYESLEGKRLDALLATPDENEQLTERMVRGEIIELLFSKGAVTDLEVVFETTDGEHIPMKLSASVMKDDGDVSGIVCVAKDISEMKKREREAKLLNDLLRRVLRHNMRNKLTTIQLGVESMLDADQERLEELQEILLGNTHALMETGEKARKSAEVIYEFSDRVQVDIVEVADRVVVESQRQFESATIETAFDVEQAPVVGHQGLERALSNLVENAVVHNDDQPWVRVGITTENDDVIVTVTDDGPPIPDSEIAVLRDHEETALEHGSGAGLWLVNWIVEKSDGTLTFDRWEGKTTVTMRLRRTNPSE
jgi:PAS domain S-box-containing protein